MFCFFLSHSHLNIKNQKKNKKTKNLPSKTNTRTVQCTRNEDCSLAEICLDGICRHPCEVRNPCAPNAACINVNHASDCSCIEGFAGNGYVLCEPGKSIYAD